MKLLTSIKIRFKNVKFDVLVLELSTNITLKSQRIFMKNQFKNPLQILVEILVFIVVNTVKSLVILGGLLYELYISLQIMSHTNPIGFIIILTFGAIILFFTSMFLFHDIISAIKIMTIYVVIIILLLTIFGGTITLPEPSTTTAT